MTTRPLPLFPRICRELSEWFFSFTGSGLQNTFCQYTHEVLLLYKRNQKKDITSRTGIFTTAEREECIPRPITNESGRIKLVRVFPIPCWEKNCNHISPRRNEKSELTIIMQPRSVDADIGSFWNSHIDAFSLTILCREKCVFMALLRNSGHLNVT